MHWLFDWFKDKDIYYEELLRKFYDNKIDYILVGGLAVSMYKVPPRFTMDVDIILKFIPENIEKFLAVLEKLGYKPKVPVNPLDFADPKKREAWIKDKNMKVFCFYHPKREHEVVDVFIEHPIDYKEMVNEKKIIKLKGLEIPIPSKKHLIALKKIAGRDNDLIDIRNLESLSEGDDLRDGE